jgi:hypothetical protein
MISPTMSKFGKKIQGILGGKGHWTKLDISFFILTPKGPRHPKWAFCTLGKVL